MGNREVSISVCGAIVGVIIGAGAISLNNGVVLDASILTAPVAFRTISEDQLVKRRNVDAQVQPQDRHNLPTIKEQKEEPVLNKEEKKDKTTCDVVKDVVAEVAAAHNRAIPETIKNTEARLILKKALENVVAKHCGTQSAQSSSAMSVETANEDEVIDNNCTRYTKYSLRYTQCKISEVQGKEYKGY